MPITDVYKNINQGSEIIFMGEDGEEIKVLSIEKEKYNGKIYDVEEGIISAPSSNRFRITNILRTNIASIDNQGNMYLKLKGTLGENYANP